jgi:hypothetical protein
MNFHSCSILLLLYFAVILLNKYNLIHLETKSEKFYQKKENSKKVQDIFHNILPHFHHFEYASDILVVSVFAYLAIMNFELVYQLGGFIFTLVLLRQLIIQMTVLPKNESCDVKDTSMFRGGCYDKIFSAHFGIAMLITLVLFDNGLINKFFMVFINLLNAFFILLSRNHYTIDIIVSIFVVVIIYQNNLNICDYLDKYLEKKLQYNI